jgi:hypothetical protein
MLRKICVTFAAFLSIACASSSPHQTVTPEDKNEVRKGGTVEPTSTLSTEQVEALFARESDSLPTLSEISGTGWSTKVPGTNAQVRKGSEEGSEVLSFGFEPSTTIDCTVHSTAFDPATTVGYLVDALKKNLEVVRIIPRHFAVEQEFATYFISVMYRQNTKAGVMVGQLKLGLAMHQSRPIICMHDAPGYSETFEKVAHSVFANYRVSGDAVPVARTITSAKYNDLPVGFAQDTVRLLPDNQTEFRSTSSQFIPRTTNELMVSDDVSVVIGSKSKLISGVFVDGDTNGLQHNIRLERGKGYHYQVTGTVADKPIEATFATKDGLLDPDAISEKLKQAFKKNKPFSFKLAEYHPSVDPTNAIEVSYYHEKADLPRVVHMKLGQTVLTMVVDENGDPLKLELPAGPSAVVLEQQYSRDDRLKAVGTMGKK